MLSLNPLSLKRRHNLQQKVEGFKNQLSKNQFELLKELAKECEPKTGTVVISLRSLKEKLNVATNTIKSCRVSLKEYGLIDYNWQTNSTTMYHILDKVNNPESFTKKDAIKKDNKMKEEDFKLDYVDHELLSTVQVYLNTLLQNGSTITNKKLRKMYFAYVNILTIDQIKTHLWRQIYLIKIDYVTKNFDLSFVETELNETISHYVYECLESGIKVTEKDVERLYLRVYFRYDGNISKINAHFEGLIQELYPYHRFE